MFPGELATKEHTATMNTTTKTSRKPTVRRGFGRIEKRPNGRYRAAYLGPDGVLHRASDERGRGITFEAKEDAEGWLADRRREIVNKTWNPPTAETTAKPKPMTFGEYGATWLASRDLKPKTRQSYAHLWKNHLEPAFGRMQLGAITPAKVRQWHAKAAPGRPTTRARAYGLLRTILGTAVYDELIPANPAHIRGAGNAKRKRKVEPLTLPQLARLVAAMPEKHQTMTLLAAWCGLRFGELTELRRKDVDLKAGILKVRRGVVRVTQVPDPLPGDTVRCLCRSGCLIGPPKSEAGVRDVAIPPHLPPAVKRHLLAHAAKGDDGLLFPDAEGTGHLNASSLYGHQTETRKRKRKDGTIVEETKPGWGFYEARVVAEVPALRWHDLRHTGAVLAAQTGATLAELMARLGHSTPNAALLYQHAAKDRDAAIAAALSKLAALAEESTTAEEPAS